jgi:hypothetical protein
MTKLLSPDAELVTMRTFGICRKCKVKHELGGINPTVFGQAAFDWQYRHRQCELESPGSIEFVTDRREFPKGFDDRIYNEAGRGPQWLDWKSNANVTTVYVADAAITMDLSALASSSTFVAGRESTSVSNSSNYLDCNITGRFISGTTPTAPGETRLYAVAPYEDTPAWPDVFDGTDSAETVTNTNIVDSLPLLWSGTVSTTSNVTYPVIGALTLAQCFGVMPKAFVLFFTHFHTAALKTDAGNTNSFNYQFIQAAVT